MDTVKLPYFHLSAWVLCCSLGMEQQFPPRVFLQPRVMLCREGAEGSASSGAPAPLAARTRARCGLRQAGLHFLLCLQAARWVEPHCPVLVEITAAADTAGNGSAVFC